MYTFLFASGIKGMPPETLLRSAGGIVKQLMPSQGVDIVESVTLLPELQGGWVRLSPTLEPPPHILSELVSDDHAVLVFGEVQHGYNETSAQVIDHTWRTQGIKAVRSLEGCFSAVLVDRVSGQIVLVSDLRGRLALRYLADGESFFVSPHDLSLVATGRCPMEYNMEAPLSILTVGFSSQHRSLLEPISSCLPTGMVIVQGGQVRRIEDPIIDLSDRIDPRNQRACAAHLDEMLEVMRDNARHLVGNRSEVETDLTGGQDTRAVLSLLLSVVDQPSQIHAFCRAEEQNWEVAAAKSLANQHGVRFSVLVPPVVKEESTKAFIPHCDLRAFHMNGDTDSNRAFGTLPAYDPTPIPRASGRGGELYRGRYTSWEMRRENGPDFSFDQALQFHLDLQARKLTNLPCLEPERAKADAAALMTQAFYSSASAQASGYDALDLYYVQERFGVWGAMSVRFPWLQKSWSPFDSPRLVRMSFRFPSPISAYSLVHKTLIRRYMPQAYWTRINQTYRLPLEGPGAARGLLRQADQKMFRATKAIQQRLHPTPLPEGGRRPVEIASAAFAGPLADPVHDILHSEGSFGRALFGTEGLQQLIDRHSRGRKRSDLQVLGFLVTMERWRAMMEAAHYLATLVRA